MNNQAITPLALFALALCAAPVAAQSEDPKEPKERVAVPAMPLMQPAAAKPASSGQMAMPLMQPAAARAAGAGSANNDAMAFAALEMEFAKAYGDWMRTVNELRGTGEKYPTQPQADFYPRFRNLANVGNIDARLWCLRYFGQYDTTPAAHRAMAWKGEAVSLATALCDNEKAGTDLVIGLMGGAAIDGVGAAGVEKIYLYMSAISSTDGVKARILATRAQTAARSSDPEQREHSLALYAELKETYPDNPLAARAQGKMFAASNLQIGQTPPNFVGKSVDGKTINLTDYRGKVLVVDFWGFW
jgi:hypothetical protein